jgi:hypothetical protein
MNKKSLLPMVPVRRKQRMLLGALFLLAGAGVHAGSAPASSSSVPGVLLGYGADRGQGPQVFMAEHHPQQFIERFRQACKNKRPIWALGLSAKLVCTQLELVPEGGDGPVYALHLQATGQLRGAHSAVVFSLNKIATMKSAARRLEQSEIAKLLAVYKSSALQAAVNNAIGRDLVQIFDIPAKRSSIYILKWKHVRDNYLSNDHFLVINRVEDRYFSVGNFEGQIVRYLDVDNDGVPEVQRSIECDGSCEAITSISRNVRDLVSIYNH